MDMVHRCSLPSSVQLFKKLREGLLAWGSGHQSMLVQVSGTLNIGPESRATLPQSVMEEFRMDLRPTHRNEHRSESARVRSSVRGTAKIVATLDEVRPWKSLVWDASRATTLPTRMDDATQIGSKRE